MKGLVISAGMGGFIAVALGAFGAHGLRDILDVSAIAVWRTAVQYQMFHVLALLAIVILLSCGRRNGWLIAAGWLFVFGVLLFSGSLYLIAITKISSLGIITPLGGLLFLLGWLSLSVALIKIAAANQSS